MTPALRAAKARHRRTPKSRAALAREDEPRTVEEAARLCGSAVRDERYPGNWRLCCNWRKKGMPWCHAHWKKKCKRTMKKKR